MMERLKYRIGLIIQKLLDLLGQIITNLRLDLTHPTNHSTLNAISRLPVRLEKK